MIASSIACAEAAGRADRKEEREWRLRLADPERPHSGSVAPRAVFPSFISSDSSSSASPLYPLPDLPGSVIPSLLSPISLGAVPASAPGAPPSISVLLSKIQSGHETIDPFL